MRTKLILALIAFSALAKAQDEIPELITDRPDQTESSAVVPHKYLQIETGFIMEHDETSSIKQSGFAYNTTLLRYGLFERFELRLGLAYLGEKINIKNTDTITTSSGLSPMYAGFKVKIADEEGWRPEIAFLGGLVLPFTANADFRPEYPAAIIGFAFSHTLSERVSLGYNLGARWNGETAAPRYVYSIALGAGITDKLGMFVESFGLIPEDGSPEHLLDAGFTYLILPNLQLDLSGGLGLNSNSIDDFISLGLSYRLPK